MPQSEDGRVIESLVTMLTDDPRPDDHLVTRWKHLHPSEAEAIDRHIAFRRRREQPAQAAMPRELDELLTSFLLAMGGRPPIEDLVQMWIAQHPRYAKNIRSFADAARLAISASRQESDADLAEAEAYADELAKTRAIDMEVEDRLIRRKPR